MTIRYFYIVRYHKAGHAIVFKTYKKAVEYARQNEGGKISSIFASPKGVAEFFAKTGHNVCIPNKDGDYAKAGAVLLAGIFKMAVA